LIACEKCLRVHKLSDLATFSNVYKHIDLSSLTKHLLVQCLQKTLRKKLHRFHSLRMVVRALYYLAFDRGRIIYSSLHRVVSVAKFLSFEYKRKKSYTPKNKVLCRPCIHTKCYFRSRMKLPNHFPGPSFQSPELGNIQLIIFVISELYFTVKNGFESIKFSIVYFDLQTINQL
jgi:hypothetical protein